MNIFEAIMIMCFGASWPFSIYKVWKSKTSAGKSFVFLWLVWVGYIAGIIHKLFYDFDWVIIFYILNNIMVFIDIVLCYRYKEKVPVCLDVVAQK